MATATLSACGGLLGVDELEFTAGGAGGGGAVSGGAAGSSTAGTGGVGGSAGGVGGSAGSAVTGGTGGTTATGGSSGNQTGGSGGCGLGSEYENAAAESCFTIEQTSGTTHDYVSGALHVEPDDQAWYGQSQGSFYYQEIGTGDFAALSHVRVESVMNPGSIPQDGFAGGGIALRAPTGVNNVLASVTTFGLPMSGNINYGLLPQYTPRNANASVNDLNHSLTGNLIAHIGMCRSGSTVYIAGQGELQSTLAILSTFPQGTDFDPAGFTQLGTATHIYETSSPDTNVFVDYLRVNRTTISGSSSCLQALEALKNL